MFVLNVRVWFTRFVKDLAIFSIKRFILDAAFMHGLMQILIDLTNTSVIDNHPHVSITELSDKANVLSELIKSITKRRIGKSKRRNWEKNEEREGWSADKDAFRRSLSIDAGLSVRLAGRFVEAIGLCLPDRPSDKALQVLHLATAQQRQLPRQTGEKRECYKSRERKHKSQRRKSIEFSEEMVIDY